MDTRLEIHGRLVVHRRGVIVRDDTRRESTTDIGEARRIADRFVADGFTAWIYSVEPGPATAPRYRGIARLAPPPQMPTAPQRHRT